MRLLHTSDWHLGRALYGRRRHTEFAAFLDWLLETIAEQRVDVLLVAGDVFDTGTPSNRAQQLYYRFLVGVAATGCRHVVVTGGNHDSPSFLEAPRELLKALDVHVIGAIGEDPADEVLVLRDGSGEAELIVCAVPYLRDRDIRSAEAGESIADKGRKLLEGIRGHYDAVFAQAERQRDGLGAGVPLVAMGHLFTAGGKTLEDDGVRELYVGSLAQVPATLFPDSLDYLALGHLHVPQQVGGSEWRRYSGSPLPMGFGEAGQQKSVCLVDFAGQARRVERLAVPCFQRLERLRGDWSQIEARLRELAAAQASIWLEIVYEGEAVIGDLRARLDAVVAGTQLEILRVKNRQLVARVLDRLHEQETLDELTPDQVFERCLDAHRVPPEQRPDLLEAYRETLRSLDDDDRRAE